MDRTGTVDQETAPVVQIKKENRRSSPQAEIPGDQAPSTEVYPTNLLGICREHSYATGKGDWIH